MQRNGSSFLSLIRIGCLNGLVCIRLWPSTLLLLCSLVWRGLSKAEGD